MVDTLSSTLGEGLLVLRAFALREKGMSLDETADTILSLRPYIAHYFTVDDLLYISRGGRVSGAKALLGTVLGIKPLLKGDEHGHIVMNGKVRGRAASIKALAEKFSNLHLLGRLAEYKYYNMDAIAKRALALCDDLLK